MIQRRDIMRFLAKVALRGLGGLVLATGIASAAQAAQCGNTSAGFDAWKQSFAREAADSGIGKRGLDALNGTSYATATIKADRGQHSFKLTLKEFMQKRGSATIVA